METSLHNLSLFLFDEFREKKVSYAILRNYEGLPDDLGSHDIDILVDRRQKQLIHSIMKQYELVFDNVSWIRIGERQYVLSYYLSYEENGNKELLQFDFFYALDWHGRTMLEADTMLAKCLSYHGFSILRPAHEAVTSLFSSLIRGGFYKEKYHSRIKELIAEDEIEFRRVLSYSVGEAESKLLRAIQDDNCKKCESMVPILRKNITRNSLKHHFWQTIMDMTKFVWWELRNRIWYAGALIAVIGGTEEERAQFAQRLIPIIFKYYKNEGVYEKYIIFPNQITKNKNWWRINLDYWRYYTRKIHKQLNKTYGLILCGYPELDGKICGKKPEVVFSLDKVCEPQHISASCSDSVLEEVIISMVKKNDKSGYRGFIN